MSDKKEYETFRNSKTTGATPAEGDCVAGTRPWGHDRRGLGRGYLCNPQGVRIS